jgi:secreted PhoX family phosphatase
MTDKIPTMDDGSTMEVVGPTLGDVVAQRFGRRDLMKGLLATAAMAAILPPFRGLASGTAPSLTFAEVPSGIDETHHVASGYDADILIRWGDPVLPDAPVFDPRNQSVAAQQKQFGYNNDYLGYVALGLDRALLCVNHEYTNPDVMFPGLVWQPPVKFRDMTKNLVDIEMAAHGASVIEIRKISGKWQVVPDSRYARRITAETPMRISGPAAGHARMKTSYDPTGTIVRGTINNCAGGITPWGTCLSGEENFNYYFRGEVAGHVEERNFKSYGIPFPEYAWAFFHDRFDIEKEPREANRFGWIVEFDPHDPAAMPVKRTALGRFKHEGADPIVNKDGRVVIYTGDDERFAFVYRFVSAGRYNPNDRAANRDLLDAGTLSAAKFNADGTMEWLDLVHGRAPLTDANGFAGQADVVIEARRAAQLLGATPMDRPEGVSPSRVTDKVYVALTNNDKRPPDRLDPANPRSTNLWGQVIEWTVPDGDHAAPRARWEMLIKAGNPAAPDVEAMYNAATTENGWFACPDNVVVDGNGRLWVSTDQGIGWKQASGAADGVFAVEIDGPLRGTSKRFFRVPVGAEMCGPLFAPDYRTFFCAMQHPAIDGVEQYAKFGRRSTFDDPATRWPDFKPDMPPRPSVVVITKKDGGIIGS